MEKRLNKSGLRLSAGFFGLLMLFGTNDSYAVSSFKNTPLYKHIVNRRNTEPVRLYEKESTDSDKQEEVAGKSSDEKIKINEEDKHTGEIKGGGLGESRRGNAARRSLYNLMDPSAFKRDMPFSEAIDILRNSTSPKLNIVVLWKDLEENADIYPDTPIGIDGVSGVSLNRHLRSLVDGVSGGAQERLGYVVDDGVVVISTLGSLPKRMVTRVYDITDLVGQPSTGFPGMGMMGMGMQGGMMGGMMPGMGGMMGGMMPGMGGMMGGMMPGLGGGYGNFGGAYGTSSGLTGTPSRPFR
jgi:hypothetical protein